ncbi:aldo/keto reductase [Enterobacter ludwigii]|uniref:aldo/keto reductase n=1 Tax=Enterobacter ludwigii TaxID=299767 RepID=UPI0003FFC402|nr:aldo/keto reductase [Enterobacter ludwigii]
MKYTKIQHAHNFDLEIPLIGFGAMGISEFYGDTDNDESLKAISLALNNGIIHFDTADGYAYGDNEKFLGKALELSNKNIRKKLLIASKAGILRDRNDPTVRGICIEDSYLKEQLYKSLDNLNTDYLDVFYIHRLPPNASVDSLSTLSEFLLNIKKQGLVRSIGLSEPKLSQLKLIHSKCPVSFVQSEYSLLERGVENNGILNFCNNERIQFVAYSPLCRGLLTDSFNIENLESGDFRRTLPRFSRENLSYNTSIVNKLNQLAKEKCASISALSISWLLAQGVLVIPGMRKMSRINDILTSLDVELTDRDLSLIDEIAHFGSAKGTRYAPAAMEAYGFE